MAKDLYQNDTSVYQAVVKKLVENGRAAVIQPAGTGKSQLVWKLLEDHPDEVIYWLVPGECRLRLRQTEGTLPEKAKLYSCEKLAAASPEEWIELAAKRPAYLILDMYQELGADGWNRSVGRLLGFCPDVKLLGLAEPNSPNKPCLSAEELFQGAVVSCYNVGEAVANGILPYPKPFATLLWSSKDVMAGLRARVKNLRSPGRPDPNEQLYTNLSYAVRDAEKAAHELIRPLGMNGGKYLVLGENYDWTMACLSRIQEMFTYNEQPPRLYCVGESPLVGSPALKEFLEDETSRVRLLVYQNRPDAQFHIDGLDGVILLRRSPDEAIFRQMFSRALTASGKQIQIVDFTNSFEGVMSMLTVRREYEDAVRRQGGVPTEFKLRDPLRQATLCFKKLKRGLENTWEEFYEAAKTCGKVDPETGKLDVPRSYITEDGLALGRWLEIQRQVRAGQRAGRLTDEQIARLDKIGIGWKQRLTLAWERGCASAKKYRDEHGDLLVPVRYHDKSGFALGEWIVYNRQRYLSGSLDPQRIERLQSMGMVWDTASSLWEQSYAAATRYYLEHGDLEIPVKYVTPDGMALGVWLGSQRTAYKDNDLKPEQVARLEAIGVDWTNRNDRRWQQAYEVAERYYQEHGDLDVPSEYVSPDGVLLGKWISRQRYAYQNPERSSARVTPERKAMLDKIGMEWSHNNSWEYRIELAEKYKKEHNGEPVPSMYKTEEGIWLGSWISRQKQRLKKNDPSLTAEQRRALKNLLKDELSRTAESSPRPRCQVRDQNWQRNYNRAKIYYKKYGDLLVPASYTDETNFRLGVWISNLRAARKTRSDSFQVTPEHIALLDEIGMEWDAREAKWGCALRCAENYRNSKGNLRVPVNYKTKDGYCLGDWIRRMRDCYARHDPKLTPERIEKLNELGMVWELDLRKSGQ
mgnify:FL=1